LIKAHLISNLYSVFLSFIHSRRHFHSAQNSFSNAAAASPSDSSPEASSPSQSVTIISGDRGVVDWETRYKQLKAERQAQAVERWKEFLEKHPEVSYPSPDGTDRPSLKVVSIVNKLLNLSVLESYQLAHLLDKTYAFSASSAPAPPSSVAPSTSAAAAPAAETPKAAEVAAKTTFSVKLESFNAADKIKVIKEIRAATGLGLKESKDLVEGAPKMVKANLAKADADALVAKLKEAGAKTSLE